MSKRAADGDLIDAIRTVAGGDTFLSSRTQQTLIKQWLEDGRTETADELTPRELEVVKLIAEAHTNRQIAEALKLSEKTVESHRANVLAKLGCATASSWCATRSAAGWSSPSLPAREPPPVMALTRGRRLRPRRVVLAARERRPQRSPRGRAASRGPPSPAGCEPPTSRSPTRTGSGSDAVVRGRPVIVTFLYTTCENTCPTQAQQVQGRPRRAGRGPSRRGGGGRSPSATPPQRARAFLSEQRMTGRMSFALGTR